MRLLGVMLALAVAGLLVVQSLRRAAVVVPAAAPAGTPAVTLPATPATPASAAQAVQGQVQQVLQQGAQETARRLQDAESASK